jgi:FkbH-like protein
MNLGRIVQLTNKTNQWNLTTQRMTEGQVRQCMADPSYYTLWVRHRDRFGDSGLIAVLIAREHQAVLHVEQWLMSCRVIKRGIEDFLFNELLDEARRRGVAAIEGTYRPTAKNALVSDLYQILGFEHVTTGEGGATRWRLDLSKTLPHRRHFINRRTSDPTTKLEEAA